MVIYVRDDDAKSRKEMHGIAFNRPLHIHCARIVYDGFLNIYYSYLSVPSNASSHSSTSDFLHGSSISIYLYLPLLRGHLQLDNLVLYTGSRCRPLNVMSSMNVNSRSVDVFRRHTSLDSAQNHSWMRLGQVWQAR